MTVAAAMIFFTALMVAYCAVIFYILLETYVWKRDLTEFCSEYYDVRGWLLSD
jgi:hypothetical protein